MRGLRVGSQQWLTKNRQGMHKKFIKKKFIVPSIATVLFVNQYNIVYLIETNLYLSSENLPVREIKWDSNWKGKGPILCWDCVIHVYKYYMW